MERWSSSEPPDVTSAPACPVASRTSTTPDKAFEKNLNTELVDLEDLSGDDFTWLKGAIERHRDETGSEVATRILADWSQQVGHFAKVMPRDYKKVLLAIAAAEKDGKNVDEAVMEAARG